MSRTTTQAITASTLTPIQLATQNYNKWGMWNSGANTRITLPQGGVWLMQGQVSYAANGVGLRYLLLRADGATYFFSDLRPAITVAGVVTVCFAANELIMTAGQYIELIAFHTSTTSPLNVEAAYMSASLQVAN